MDRDLYEKIWEELLEQRGLRKFKKMKMGNEYYLRTNYRITEPDGKERNETWVIVTKDSISPSEIVSYNTFIENSNFDYGIFLTPGTLTVSGFHVLNQSAPFVRVYDYDTFTESLRQSPEIAQKYDIKIGEVLPEKARIILQRLGECLPGDEAWKRYENLIEEIFNFLFVPPLDEPRPQSRGENGLEIRDLVYPNRASEGFWEYVRSEYKGSYVVVEAKNKEETDKNDVLQLSDYLVERQLGLFGVLFSRGISESAIEQRRKAYSTDPHRMIILLDDKDVSDMITKRSRKEAPEDILGDRIDLYRVEYRF